MGLIWVLWRFFSRQLLAYFTGILGQCIIGDVFETNGLTTWPEKHRSSGIYEAKGLGKAITSKMKFIPQNSLISRLGQLNTDNTEPASSATTKHWILYRALTENWQVTKHDVYTFPAKNKTTRENYNLFKIQFLREFRDRTLLSSSMSITFDEFFHDLGLSCRYFPCFRVFFDLTQFPPLSVQQPKKKIMVAARAF